MQRLVCAGSGGHKRPERSSAPKRFLSGFELLRLYSSEQKMTDSQTLLSLYARTGSEPAFRELVSRYIDLVYSTAFRLVGEDAQAAQDVAQTVFVALADKAKTLPKDVMLGGWLHQHTRFVAGGLMRTERRRQLRERQAAEMNAIEDHSKSNLAQVAPVLDEAIGQLDAEDRIAILLRFFERKDFRSIGDALGSSGDAARKRVDRALEKLHVFLKQRGSTLSAVALGTALAAEAVAAAPAGLAAGVAGAALASVAASGGITATLVKLMTMTKLKLCVISAIFVASAAAPFAVQYLARVHLREEDERLLRQNHQLIQLAADNQRLSNLLAGAKIPAPSSDQHSQLLKLRGEIGRLRAQAQELRQERTGTSRSGTEMLASAKKSWAARVDQLKQWLETNPSEKILELRFLTDNDWLNSVYPHTLETPEEYRQAMSTVRANAEGRVMKKLHAAFRQYARDNNGQLATDLSQLKPYLDSPIDDAILQRYEIVAATNLVSELQTHGDWVITQKAPVNEALDVRQALGLDTGGKADCRITNRWISTY